MYFSLKSLLLNTRHLFIKEKRKLKLSLTHFQNKFWGYVVCLDHESLDSCGGCNCRGCQWARNFLGERQAKL
ncbi:hypothetical protein Hanom_Chr14g01274161 [Helianthus anomalus]